MRPTLAAALLAAAGCAATPRQPPPPPAPFGAPEVRAVRVHETIIVDGVDNDPGWRECPETEVALQGKEGPPSCFVRAAVFRGTLFLALRWVDETESRTATGFYEPGHGEGDYRSGRSDSAIVVDAEDAVEITLPISGPFPLGPDSPGTGRIDDWYWGASSTDGLGRARDGFLDFTLQDDRAEPFLASYPDGRTLIASRMDDTGIPVPRLNGSKGGLVLVQAPDGGAADVLARGQWRAGEWTVEFGRALDTASPDDSGLANLDEIALGIAIIEVGARPRLFKHRMGPLSRGPDPPSPTVLRLLLPPPEDARPVPLPEPLGPPAGGR